jgi:hypothetical protein
MPASGSQWPPQPRFNRRRADGGGLVCFIVAVFGVGDLVDGMQCSRANEHRYY